MSTRSLGTIIMVVWLTMWLVVSAEGQFTLTGTNYTQNFNAISNGLPPGWSVRTNATATSLGLSATFPTVVKSWVDTTGEFGNCAALTNNAGVPAVSAESSATQAMFTNRMLGVRQTKSFGDPGAAFVFQITNTLGFSNLTFSLDLSVLKSNGYSTTWTIAYCVGDTLRHSPCWAPAPILEASVLPIGVLPSEPTRTTRPTTSGSASSP
jgi:hypothetical protein